MSHSQNIQGNFISVESGFGLHRRNGRKCVFVFKIRFLNSLNFGYPRSKLRQLHFRWEWLRAASTKRLKVRFRGQFINFKISQILNFWGFNRGKFVIFQTWHFSLHDTLDSPFSGFRYFRFAISSCAFDLLFHYLNFLSGLEPFYIYFALPLTKKFSTLNSNFENWPSSLIYFLSKFGPNVHCFQSLSHFSTIFLPYSRYLLI
jgi:hypothetical protein